MKAVVTGGQGFLGWHLSCRLRTLQDTEPVRLGREGLMDPEVLAASLSNADVVFHLAGVNRAESDEAIQEGNLAAARALATALQSVDHAVRVVYANSTQALLDNPYGRGKAGAAELLRQACAKTGNTFVDVRLPNLFGEHGRPHYNSVVATFCHLVATEQEPQVHADRELPLLHAQRAAQVLIDAAEAESNSVLEPAGRPMLISSVLDTIKSFHATYSLGDLPSLRNAHDVDLFNTYRSFVFPDSFPRHPQVHADPRGALFETSRAHGGTSQTFVSTTRPGQKRGDHYHLHKIERFFVVRGEADIGLRRLLDDKVVRFRLSGDEPGFVDMPTLWVHDITNVGNTDLVTMFWSDQLLDLEHPDQFPERVII